MDGHFELGLPVIEVNIGDRKIKAILDTGFNGELMLPNEIIDELKQEQIGLADYITAGGDSYIARMHIGRLKIFGEEKDIAVLSSSAGFSCAGMQLFHSCKIILERHKDKVEIEKTG